MVRANDRGTLGLTVSVDPHSGFCNGVVRAIREAERHLHQDAPLYSLGAIVHNNEELARLRTIGLHTLEPSELSTLYEQTIVIRAHGEPPNTYQAARNQKLRIIDCTCPVVLKLQKKIKDEHARIAPIHGQIAIFGKAGHAEINGLVGQVEGDALIIEHSNQIEQLDYSRPLSLFAQTTQDPIVFVTLCRNIEALYRQHGVDPTSCFRTFNTICKQVAERRPILHQFAKSHHTLIFVCGKESSNGKVLFEACKEANPHSFQIENSKELCRDWFSAKTLVGVCGATSTPKWLMDEVAQTIREM